MLKKKKVSDQHSLEFVPDVWKKMKQNIKAELKVCLPDK